MSESLDQTAKRKQMAQLEQLVTVTLQDGRHEEAEVLEKLTALNGITGPTLDAQDIGLISGSSDQSVGVFLTS